ncbi:MAG: hypothetical protein RLY97_1976 [Pseudomonadota bacterium]
MTRNFRPKFLTLSVILGASVALSGCKTKGDIVIEDGIGVSAVRTSCPSVGIPDYTGDVTLFGKAGASDAGAVNLTAAMTNVRSNCNSSGEKVYAAVSFDVLARRNDTGGARSVTLPYFVTVVRGGTAVIAKRIGSVTINFADGQTRAQISGKGGAYIDKAEATLPRDVRERITRKRKAGESDAAIDPLSQPDVRAAVTRASFEVLVGFQLSDDQLKYNATR